MPDSIEVDLENLAVPQNPNDTAESSAESLGLCYILVPITLLMCIMVISILSWCFKRLQEE